MSEYIPYEVQVEIVKRLPVKSLIQFRSVSKAWKSLIDTPDFIVTHSTSHAHSHRLLLRYETHPGRNKHCISFADDETFPQEKFEPDVPSSVERFHSKTTEEFREVRLPKNCSLIISFDMTTEEFREVRLPDSLAFQTFPALSISKLRDSLAVVEYTMTGQKEVCSVWEMKHGVETSFTKLFTIEAPVVCRNDILGFRKSGKPLMLNGDRSTDQNGHSIYALAVYEPSSESINDFGIYGVRCSFSVNSYMETLLLFNLPES